MCLCLCVRVSHTHMHTNKIYTFYSAFELLTIQKLTERTERAKIKQTKTENEQMKTKKKLHPPNSHQSMCVDAFFSTFPNPLFLWWLFFSFRFFFCTFLSLHFISFHVNFQYFHFLYPFGISFTSKTTKIVRFVVGINQFLD